MGWPFMTWLCLLNYSLALSTSGRNTPNASPWNLLLPDLVARLMTPARRSGRWPACSGFRRALPRRHPREDPVAGMMAAALFSAMPKRAAIDHVVDRALDCAVDGVGRNIDSGTAAGNVFDRKGTRGIRRAVCGCNSGAQLNKVVDIARQQRHAVDGIGVDELPDRRIAGFNQSRWIR